MSVPVPGDLCAIARWVTGLARRQDRPRGVHVAYYDALGDVHYGEFAAVPDCVPADWCLLDGPEEER